MSLTPTHRNPSSERKAGTDCTETGSVMGAMFAGSVCTGWETRRGWPQGPNCLPTSFSWPTSTRRWTVSNSVIVTGRRRAGRPTTSSKRSTGDCRLSSTDERTGCREGAEAECDLSTMSGGREGRLQRMPWDELNGDMDRVDPLTPTVAIRLQL